MTNKGSKLAGLLLLASAVGFGASHVKAGVEEGLVAYYPFEEASLGADATGHGHDLNNLGVTAGTGIQGSGAVFDGFSSLETTDVSELIAEGDFTWSTWFLVEDEELSGGLLSLSPDAWEPGAKALFKGEESFLAFDVGWLGAAEYEEDILDGEWHHASVVTRFDSDEGIGILELFIDGNWVSEIEGETEAFGQPDNSVFRVGSGSPGDPDLEEDGEPFPDPPHFSGTLDEVRLHNRALELEEIREMVILGLGSLEVPEILSEPEDVTGIVGRTITLQVDADGLFASYQWFKDGVAMEDQEDPALELEDLSSEDAATYRVTITNDAGSVSAEMQVSLLEAWSPEVNLLGLFTFESSGDLGKDASGQGNDLFDLFAAQGEGSKGKGLSLDGLGRLEDTDGELPFTSLSDFTWTAFIKTENEETTLLAKSPGDDDEDSPNVWAPGSKALFIREGELAFDTGWIGDVQSGEFIADGQWHHVGISIDFNDGEDLVQLWVDGNPSGTWDDADLEEQPDPGIFFIGYSSDDFPFDLDANWFQGQIDQVRLYEQALIQEDIITVFLEDGGKVEDPSIEEHPMDTSIVEGRTARFSVGVSGTGLSYQWKKDGEAIDGATGVTLNLKGVQKSDAGNYSLVVISPHSTPPVQIESNPAALSVEDAPFFVGGDLAHLGAFLEAFWNFDTLDDGRVSDLSPQGNHDGELVNDAELTSGNQGYGGAGEALNTFDGDMAHLAAMNPEAFDFNSDFTWTARIFLDEPAPEGDEVGSGILGRSPADSEHNQGSKILYVSGLRVGFDTGWVGAVNSEEILELETWHQLTLTYLQEEDLISIWVDDSPVISNEDEEVVDFEFDVDAFPEDEAFGGGFVNSGFRLGGGANEFFSDPFPGLIDDVAVWSTVLSEEDILQLAGGASPLPEIGEKPELPSIQISRADSSLTITFEGQLESSDAPNGDWEAVENASSPHMVDVSSVEKQFYRATR
ncbi:MAG: hypothetical protein P8L18_12095 [Verrucomicrobiota bacterium]|nr:hypothetical protein [Verrucomicrobiota bacterium]